VEKDLGKGKGGLAGFFAGPPNSVLALTREVECTGARERGPGYFRIRLKPWMESKTRTKGKGERVLADKGD